MCMSSEGKLKVTIDLLACGPSFVEDGDSFNWRTRAWGSGGHRDDSPYLRLGLVRANQKSTMSGPRSSASFHARHLPITDLKFFGDVSI